MQCQFRIDDNNYIDVDFKLQAAGDGSPLAGPEIIAATITKTQLSDLKADDVFNIVGQIVDYFAVGATPERAGPEPDWRQEWLESCR